MPVWFHYNVLQIMYGVMLRSCIIIAGDFNTDFSTSVWHVYRTRLAYSPGT